MAVSAAIKAGGPVLYDRLGAAFVGSLDAVRSRCDHSRGLMRRCGMWFQIEPVNSIGEWFGPVVACRAAVALHLL